MIENIEDIEEVEDDPLFRQVEAMFYNYEDTKEEIKNLEEEIEFIEEDYEYRGCGAIEYSEKVQKSCNIESSVEIEVMQKMKILENLKKLKRKKERDIKRIERAKRNFNHEEKEMFKIRYTLKIKDWTMYAEKINVGRDKYYNIRYRMIKKSINTMYPHHNMKDTPMEKFLA
ncbi:hypothetical protein [Romboutsia sp. MSSM.1001216sp_RTP31141st1_G3_RTP31141_220114]|uniref:hypothetical protein n=1 Tax=unclassified Romboutsia TaxID=2626894 RepID=UPI0031B59FDA